MTFEQYLRADLQRRVIDFAMRAQVNAKGDVEFYIHPANTDGLTMDFIVEGNLLTPRR